MNVTVQKRTHIFVSRRNFVLVQDAEDNSRVGHARDLDIVQIIVDSEPLLKCSYQRVDSRAARVDQRAVDVEKQQAFLIFCHVKRSPDIYYCSLSKVAIQRRKAPSLQTNPKLQN